MTYKYSLHRRGERRLAFLATRTHLGANGGVAHCGKPSIYDRSGELHRLKVEGELTG